MTVTKSVVKLIQGWLPKEPLLKGHAVAAPVKPEVKARLDEKITKKLIKTISITNPIISTIFITSNFATYGSWWNLENMVLTCVELIFVLLAANVSIFLYLRYRTLGGGV